MILHHPWLTGNVQFADTGHSKIRPVAAQSRRELRSPPGLHVDDHGGVFLAILQLAMHLAPGAPHAETGSGDILTVGALSKKQKEVTVLFCGGELSH